MVISRGERGGIAAVRNVKIRCGPLRSLRWLFHAASLCGPLRPLRAAFHAACLCGPLRSLRAAFHAAHLCAPLRPLRAAFHAAHPCGPLRPLRAIYNMQQLNTFQNNDFDRGASKLKELGWMLVSALCFRHSLAVWNGAKVWLLRAFGAQVGRGVLVKPSVHIKFPWKLSIGDHVWIGEQVWIDNLDQVVIQDHVCISQGAMLLCGNHDYKKPTFDLMTGPITLGTGSWIGAKSIVGPGVQAGSHAVLSAGSVASKDLDSFSIYQGNPATVVRKRDIEGNYDIQNKSE